MGGKTGKIALAVIVLIAAGLLALRSFRDPTNEVLPNEFAFVCVESGEIFNMSMDEVLSIPAKNPKTGKKTLLPCRSNKDGVWHVVSRYRTPLTSDLRDVNKAVDTVSLEVRAKQ